MIDEKAILAAYSASEGMEITQNEIHKIIEAYEAAKVPDQPSGLSDAVEDSWNKFYQLSFHSGLTTRDIFTFGFEAAYLKATKRESGSETELQRVRGFLLMYLDHGKYKDDPDTRKLFMQFSKAEEE